MAEANKRLKCVVIGAGPVGALAALYAANRGWDVEIYELRGDLRLEATTPLNFTKSINLALSERGINAMRLSGSPRLLEDVLSDTVPMYGRMIHGQDSAGALTEEAQQYDVHGRFLRAVDRANLNSALLDELEDMPNVRFFFHHKVTGVDFRRRLAWLEQSGPSRKSSSEFLGSRAGGRPGRPDEIEVDFDLILGCDGAHSSVRFHMMKYVRLDYAQTYIDTLWCEFRIPPVANDSSFTPSAKDGFATSPNHLHIWPGKDKMFIAIPSIDQSFTCTLFAPATDFAALENDTTLVEHFFNTHFPGAVDLMGPGSLQEQFEDNPHLPLISIKCSPHVFGSAGAILGDAAHAMVPFYGQGMNAGLEDVRILFEHLDSQPPTERGRLKALASYNAERVPDAHTICDLALANYWEMHAGVRSSLYLLRKNVEEFLSDKIPRTGFATQYSRVSFSNERYSEVSRVVAWQRHVLIRGLYGAFLLPTVGLAVWLAWRVRSGAQLPGLSTTFAFARQQIQHALRYFGI